MSTRLIICPPFLPQVRKTASVSDQIWMVSSLEEITQFLDLVAPNFEEIQVDERIFDSVKLLQRRSKDLNIQRIPSVTEPQSRPGALRLGVLVSSDTQVSYLGQIADYFSEVLFVIPSRRSKDDGAAATLEFLGLQYVELEYEAEEHEAISAFSADFFLVASDWTSEFLALRRVLPEETPIVALQEGPHDYQTRFKQKIRKKWVMKENHQYRNADMLLSQGSTTISYLRPRYFGITGNPKINYERWNPPEQCRMALVNQNFTYPATKPNYESRGDVWMSEVTAALRDQGIEYFVSKHPRDQLVDEYGATQPSSATQVADQLATADLVISRLSSIIYEAMAQGRQAIYYNGHDELAFVFHLGRDNGYWIASNPSELRQVLCRIRSGERISPEAIRLGLVEHCAAVPTYTNGIFHLAKLLNNLGSSRRIACSDDAYQTECNDSSPLSPDGIEAVAIVGRNGRDGYSGGRYHSWMQALALVRAGYRTYYVTNEVPTFVLDLRRFSEFQKLRIVLSRDFDEVLIEEKIKAVIVVPGMDTDERAYRWANRCRDEMGAQLVLLNFESPNFFNATSPVRRDPNLWVRWNEFSERADIILSSAATSMEYARTHYSTFTRADCRHAFVGPCINTAAEAALAGSIKEKRILLFCRFNLAEHKGVDQLGEILSAIPRGWLVQLVVGSGTIPEKVELELRSRRNVELEILHSVSDIEKFRLLKSSRVLLFPSFFEGFGYPPIEALYCGVNVVAFDLPILRETCGDRIHYARLGDWGQFKKQIRRACRARPPKRDPHIENLASLDRYAREMNAVLNPNS